MTSSLLILTVGTGTAGRESNVAEGLANSVRMLRPRGYWLVPSASEKSRPVADLIRDMVADTAEFIPWRDTDDYLAIPHPDAIENCRQVVREVIQKVRQSLRQGERLLVNPTSGTKQMSAGAVLAALDEGVGEIIFTVGERADGVVRTGTERLEVFDPKTFYAERDLALAKELAASGAPGAANRVLRRHESLCDAADVALCLHEWERQNYEVARQIAARSRAAELLPVRAILTDLAQAAATGKPHLLVVKDLLVTAEAHLHRDDWESALTQTCKALEMGLRLRLLETAGVGEPYLLEQLRELSLRKELMERLERSSRNRHTCILGLRQVIEVLECLGDSLAETWRANRRLQELVITRNELTHAIRSVTNDEAEEFLHHTRTFLDPLGDWSALPPRPKIGEIS